MKSHIILLAGGSGSRMGASINKILLPLDGEPVIRRSARAFESFSDDLIVVCRPEDKKQISKSLSGLSFSSVRYAEGGPDRQTSVYHGLLLLENSQDDLVLIHDGARCLVNDATIQAAIETYLEKGSCVAAVPLTDTVKICSTDRQILSTPDRSVMFAVQTPQVFRVRDILSASRQAQKDGYIGTDDASLLERLGRPVFISPGSVSNLKITRPEDMIMAQALLDRTLSGPRVGTGYDVHRLVPHRKLILCGVEIPHSLGLLGHSDADVAVHSLIDAMFGAAALGDIGSHFPDTDEKYRGISSMLLLKEAQKSLREAGYQMINADITIVAQAPKLRPYIDQMRINLSQALSMPLNNISVKATTTEHLGFEGREEGISAQAVCMIVPVS